MHSQTPGALIGGRYRIRSALGRGGMGTVWSCLDETLDRDVAVKEVGLLPGASVTDAARAYREARSSAALAHPHVVTVYDIVEEDERLWMVMEEVTGRSLSQMIDQNGPLDPATVAHIGAQIADGLAAAHAAGTIHRDVKPGNILVRDDGVAKISDFGIARIQGDPTLTHSGDLTGTPSYFSPEVARGEEPGRAADVWALGATLYAAVEGRPAYSTQQNPVAVLHQIATTDPSAPQRAGFLGEPLARMLDRDPASRWTMADAAHVLQRLSQEHRSSPTLAVSAPEAGPAAAPKPEGHEEPRPPRRRRGGLPLLGIAVVVLLLAGAALWLLSSQGTTSSDGAAQPRPQDGSSSGSTQDSRPASDASASASDAPQGGWDASAMEELVRDYYARAPGGNDAAWQMLGPQEQAQGRESYDSFWQGIDRVEVQQASAHPSSHTVDVTLVYHRSDGTTSTERKREGLVRAGDHYLVNSDQPRA